MGIQSTSFYDSGARRRRLIYLLSFLVIAGCGVAVWLLSRTAPEPPDRTAAVPGDGSHDRSPPGTGSEDAPEPPAPGGGADTTGSTPPVPPLPAVEEPELARAQELFEAAMGLVKKTRVADRASPEARAARRAALDALLRAQDAYESWIERHPEAEERLSRRMSDLQQQLYWVRKGMGVDEFPASSEPPAPGLPTPAAPPARKPPPPADAPPEDRPRPGPTPRPLAPDREVARFKAVAWKALREGRPDRILEAGLPLLDDPRMEGHLGEIPETVEAARSMVAFLEAARTSLAARLNAPVRLRLRVDQVEGTLVAAGDEILVRMSGGDRKLRISDLAATELLELSRAGGRKETPENRRTAGAYLVLRGEEEEGVRQLLLARAGGEDVSEFQKHIDRGLARSPELRALAGYIDLAGMARDGNPALLGAVEKWKRDHRDTEVFEERREEVFRDYATIAAARSYEIEDLYSVPVKRTGKDGIHLLYPFDREAELDDFETRGKWKVEGGSLVGGGGTVRIERFDLESADVRIVLEHATGARVGFWGPDDRGRDGVSLSLEPQDDELVLTLRYHDHTLATETVRAPRGPLELLIQRRDRKYQVRLNRKGVLRGSQLSNQSSAGLSWIGVASRDQDLVVRELEIRTSLDLDWANAGGRKFCSWVRDWYVTGTFPHDGKDLKVPLLRPHWPEERPFSPADTEGGQRWRLVPTSGWLDLNRCFRTNDRVVAYAAARVWSPEKRSAVLSVRLDDDARVWLNGELVLKEAPLGETHHASVHLNEGENDLLLKVVEQGGPWWVLARFLTKDGRAMGDLQYW